MSPGFYSQSAGFLVGLSVRPAFIRLRNARISKVSNAISVIGRGGA
jgi:hypothetical protein